MLRGISVQLPQDASPWDTGCGPCGDRAVLNNSIFRRWRYGWRAIDLVVYRGSRWVHCLLRHDIHVLANIIGKVTEHETRKVRAFRIARSYRHVQATINLTS